MDLPKHAVSFILFLHLNAVSPTVSKETLRFANFEMVSGLKNYIIKESALWIKRDVRSQSSCAVACLKDIRCRSFFYKKQTKYCSGHSSVHTSRAMATDDPGSRYYIIPAPKGSIGERCSHDNECNITEFAVCYMSICRCTPGYSFSPIRQTCNRKCSSYSSIMTPYPGLAVAGHNSEILYATAVEECINRCVTAVTTCLSVDTYSYDGRCSPQECGYLDVDPRERETGLGDWVYYHRDCAD